MSAGANDTPIPASLASPHALTSYHSFHDDLPPSNVPEGYNRFHHALKPATFPSTRIVGLLACQRDPYLRELKGVEVVASRKAVQEQDKSRSKKKPKGDVKQDQAEAVDEAGTWEVELKDTVLFPEGELEDLLNLLSQSAKHDVDRRWSTERHRNLPDHLLNLVRTHRVTSHQCSTSRSIGSASCQDTKGVQGIS
jgi:hypothetical protein